MIMAARHRQAALLVPALALALAARAAAAETFNVHGFDAPTDPFAYIQNDGAKALDPAEVFGAGYFVWTHRPFLTPESRGGAAGRSVVEDAYDLDLVGGVGLPSIGHSGLALGVAVPIVVRELGYSLGDPNERLRASGVGDVRTDLKLAILDRDDDVVGLSVRIFARWPTGRDVEFASDERISVGGVAAFEYHAGFLRVGLEAGYQWTDGDMHAGGVTLGEAVLLGFGLAIAPLSDIRGWEPLEIVFEARHAARPGDPYDRQEEAPVEVGGALRWGGRLFALLGGSAGLNRGVGVGDARLVAALGLSF
jgi:hypothetical protein